MTAHRPRFTLRQFGPAIGPVRGAEMLRAALGAFAAILVVELLITFTPAGRALGLYLIAPFGASSVLLFAVPNSPLAQPWSAVIGNAVSAIAGVAAVLWIPDPVLRIAVAAGGAIFLMHLARALHPPGGAVAMTAALAPDLIHDLGFGFVLSPVILGTVLLTALAALWAAVTGRHYPFRQTEPLHEATEDEEPKRDPLGLSREDLAALLADFRQSPNIGVEDLARLIAAAEDRAANLRLGNLTCAEVMTRDPVTVDLHMPIGRIADLFAKLGYTALPVVEGDGEFRGMIFQIHLIRQAVEAAERQKHGFRTAFRDLLTGRGGAVSARDIMRADGPRLHAETPAIALLPLLAEGVREAVPILEGGRITGIVTRTDLVARLEEELIRRS